MENLEPVESAYKAVKLKELKQWMEMLPNEFLEYDLMVAMNGIQPNGFYVYQKEFTIRGFDVDEFSKQILFLHAIDDEKPRIRTNIL